MRLSREDVAPVLAIMVGAALSMVAIAGVVEPSLSSDAVASTPEVVLIEEVLQAQRERVVVETRRSRVAGVNITNSGSQGGSSRIVIRGENWTSSNNQPLFIVDGVPMEPGLLDATNPEEIESVTVLKGDNAVRLYGEGASGGVVIISLKAEEPTVHLP